MLALLNSSSARSLTGTTSIDPTRTLVVTGGTLNTGSVANNGTLTLYSGALTTNTATLGTGGTLSIGLAGIARNTNYGALVASSSVSLAGTLQVSLLNSFMPAAGNSFDILDWVTPNGLTGTFSTLQLPALAAGLTWNTSQLYTTGVLSVAGVAGTPGDYNNNGTVDAADYVLWRKYQGSTHVLPNDSTGGTIGAAQSTTWRAHFGQPPGSGSGATVSTAVPEPTTLVLLMFAAASWCLLRSRVA